MVDWKDYRSWSLLLARFVVAFIFLYHGIPKALPNGISENMGWTWAAQKFAGWGFPGFFEIGRAHV